MIKSLLALTTSAGMLQFLRDAVATLEDSLEILVIDDASPRDAGIAEFCEEKGVLFVGKEKAMGLTHSWNLAYSFMARRGYENCILCNDDVRFPTGFSIDLLRGLEKFAVVCPISNLPTRNEQMFRPQWAKRYHDLPMSPRRKNRNLVQATLAHKYRKKPFREVTTFNGFCFAFSRAIEKYMYSGAHLFNPALINTKNEFDLGRRIKKRGGRMAVCKTSYVWHWKAATLSRMPKKDWLWSDVPYFKEQPNL